ncbi:MAG: ATP-binding protein [Synechococcaceae cyanobacterium]|nr:ATP-binding protein [Synechococcaceae cyanobacterium]
MVKLLVEAMGGRLAVESQIDRGSCFAIHLPAIGSDAPLSSARVPDPAR